MRIKQWSWVAAVLVTVSTLGCGGTPERKEVSVEDLEQKAAAGQAVNAKGAARRLEKQQAREEAQGEAPAGQAAE